MAGAAENEDGEIRIINIGYRQDPPSAAGGLPVAGRSKVRRRKFDQTPLDAANGGQSARRGSL
jgi:hypothetical protein